MADLAGLHAGFQIEIPRVRVGWGIATEELKRLLPVDHVTDAYYTTRCTSLNGLEHVLGFHFEEDRLNRLEFVFAADHDPDRQYPIWQRHLESTFGAPTATSTGVIGFPSHYWSGVGVRVHHVVVERFGLEEHVGITKP